MILDRLIAMWPSLLVAVLILGVARVFLVYYRKRFSALFPKRDDGVEIDEETAKSIASAHMFLTGFLLFWGFVYGIGFEILLVVWIPMHLFTALTTSAEIWIWGVAMLFAFRSLFSTLKRRNSPSTLFYSESREPVWRLVVYNAVFLIFLILAGYCAVDSQSLWKGGAILSLPIAFPFLFLFVYCLGLFAFFFAWDAYDWVRDKLRLS